MNLYRNSISDGKPVRWNIKKKLRRLTLGWNTKKSHWSASSHRSFIRANRKIKSWSRIWPAAANSSSRSCNLKSATALSRKEWAFNPQMQVCRFWMDLKWINQCNKVLKTGLLQSDRGPCLSIIQFIHQLKLGKMAQSYTSQRIPSQVISLSRD